MFNRHIYQKCVCFCCHVESESDDGQNTTALALGLSAAFLVLLIAMFCLLIKCSRYRHLYDGSSVDVFVNQSVDHLRKYMASRKAAAQKDDSSHPRLAPTDPHQVEESNPVDNEAATTETGVPHEGPSLAISKHDGGAFDFEYNNVSKYDAVAGRKNEYEFTSNAAATSAAATSTSPDSSQGPQANGPQGATTNPEVHNDAQKSHPAQVPGAGLHTYNQSLSTITPFTEGRGSVNHSGGGDPIRENGHYVMSSVDWDISMRNLGVSTKNDITNSGK